MTFCSKPLGLSESGVSQRRSRKADSAACWTTKCQPLHLCKQLSTL